MSDRIRQQMKGWGPVEWEGRARMAAARRHAEIALDVVDREALGRHPQPEGIPDE